MNYDVTIGIPVYNVENYLNDSLLSALAQTYPDIEFLLVDDGSTDRSLSIIERLQQEHERGNCIRLITLNKNQGPSAARNRMIEEAKGEFLYFMDSDDTIREDTISLMMENIHRYEADIVFGSYQKIDNDQIVSSYQYPDVQFLQPDELGLFSYRCYAGIQASACNFLVRTDVLRQNGLRFYPVNFWEDMVFTLDLVTLPLRAVMLSSFTYRYLQREGSLSHNGSYAKSDILRQFSAIEHLKQGSLRLKEKSYYPGRCYVAVMTDFYIICNLLKNRKKIRPSMTNGEMMAFMTHPASLSEILCFRQKRLANLLLWLLCLLPSNVGLFTIKLIGIHKKLI